MANSPEIMTVQEVAELLRVSERTVYDWATTGQVPCGKFGTSWRFKRSDVKEWIDSRLSTNKPTDPAAIISFRDILDPAHVVKFDTNSKREALQQLLNVVCTDRHVENEAEVEKGIFHREELMSTGIGLGMAVPHVRLKSIKKPLMAVGISASDITDYDSIDDKPVRLLFMILAGQNQHVQHVRIMARISRFVKERSVRDSLLNAPNAQSAYDLLIQNTK